MSVLRIMLMALFQTIGISFGIAVPCAIPVACMHAAMVDVTPYIMWWGVGSLVVFLFLFLVGIISEKL